MADPISVLCRMSILKGKRLKRRENGGRSVISDV